MLPAAAFFITGLFLAMQFHMPVVSCAALAAAIVFSVLSKKFLPAIFLSTGLLLGHFYTAGAPAHVET